MDGEYRDLDTRGLVDVEIPSKDVAGLIMGAFEAACGVGEPPGAIAFENGEG